MAAPKRIDELTAGGTLSAAAAVAVVMAGNTVQVAASKFITEAESFTQSGSGATSRKAQAKMREAISVTDFGATGDGTTDDATAFSNALTAASGKALYVPTGTYLIGSAQTVPANTLIYGDGKYVSIVKKGFNGDLFTLASNAGIRDLKLDGNRGTYTGRNVVISTASSFGQWMDNIQSVDSESYDVEYTAADVGSQSFIVNSQLGGRSSHTAVKYPTDTTAVPRSIINCQGGGSILLDCGGATDFWFAFNFTNGITFSSSSSDNGVIVGNRFATAGGTTTIDGAQHHITGNVFAGPVVLAATSSNCVVNGNLAPDWDITDNGTTNILRGMKKHVLDATVTAAGDTIPLSFNGDPNTGLFRPGADILAWATGGTERGRTTASGYLKVSNDGSYVGSTATVHELDSTDGTNAAVIVENSHATTPRGVSIRFTGGSPDDNVKYFLHCTDSTTDRCFILADGDLQNHDNSYGAISDERLKQDIIDAGSQWADIKNLRVRKYRFKSDVEAGKNHQQIGLIAQEVRPVSPGLVTEGEDGMLAVQYSVANVKLLKAFQEAQARIERLEAEVSALKGGR